MNDPNTSEYTMGSTKKSVPQTLKQLEMEQGSLQSQIDALNKMQAENEKRLDRHEFKFKILWTCAGIAGTIGSIIFTWLLGKI